MKGFDVFFANLKQGGEDMALNEELKKTDNTLLKILKLEKKEAAANEDERKKDKTRRERAARAKKRNIFSGQVATKKAKEKEKKKGFNWLALGLAAIGLGGLLATFAPKLIKELKDWADKKIKELTKSFNDNLPHITESISNFAWDSLKKFGNAIDISGERREEQLHIDEFMNDPALKGLTYEEKVAKVREQATSGSQHDGVRAEARERLNFLESGALTRYEGLAPFNNKETNVSRNVLGDEQGLRGGDLVDLLESVDDSSEDASIVKELIEDSVKQRELEDQILKAREGLANSKGDVAEEAKFRTRLETAQDKLKAITETMGHTIGAQQHLMEALTKIRDRNRKALGRTKLPPIVIEVPDEVLARQRGGSINAAKTKKVILDPTKPGVTNVNLPGVRRKDEKLDERTFSTTGFARGATIDPIKRQKGGLVLFQGHGDVPIGHSQPGTDGPGTPLAGKYKPTAEQYFSNKVNVATEQLAKKENVNIRYQRPKGRFKYGTEPNSNWGMMRRIRANGGSAVETHFDAYGHDQSTGKWMDGVRGMLTKNHPAKSAIDHQFVKNFGIHPMNYDGYGAFIVELDSLKHAPSRVNTYARMIVDTVKGVDSSGYSGSTDDGDTSSDTSSDISAAPKTTKVTSFSDDTSNRELEKKLEEIKKLRAKLEDTSNSDDRIDLIHEISDLAIEIRKLKEEAKTEAESRGEATTEGPEPDNPLGFLDAIGEFLGEAAKPVLHYTKTLLTGIAEHLGIDLGDLLVDDKKKRDKLIGDATNVTSGENGSDSVDYSGDDATGAPISGAMEQKAITIAKRLMSDFNISKQAAAGILGNLMLESGLKPDNVEDGKGFSDGPINNIPVGTRRVGYGYGQWTNDRLESFRGFLTKRGQADVPATDEDNYQYLHWELNNKEPIRGHWKGWNGRNIPEDDAAKAATWFMMNWERPGEPHQDRRQQYARQVAAKLQKGGVVGGPTPNASVAPATSIPAAMGVSQSTSPSQAAPQTTQVIKASAPQVNNIQITVKPVVNTEVTRMNAAYAEYSQHFDDTTPPVIIVQGGGGGQKPSLPSAPRPSTPPTTAGGGINIVDARQMLHRINSGALF